MSSALTRLLTDFDAGPRHDLAAGALPQDTDGAAALRLLGDGQALSDEDPGHGEGPTYAVVRSAYQAGIEKGRRESEELIESARAEGAAAVREEIEAARQELLTGILHPLADQLSQSYAALGDAIEKGVVEALAPLINEELKRQALQSLRNCTEELLAGRTDCLVSITAPEELADELAAHLAPLCGVANIVPAPGGDIEVKIDDTILNVQIGQLGHTMQEIFD